MAETRLVEAMNELRSNVAGTRAIVLLGPDGIVLDHLLVDAGFDLDAFASEYAMLLRIAQSTSDDTGSGILLEHISISEHAIILARRCADDHFLVLVSQIQDEIGRARYELKRAARHLDGKLQNRRA